MEGQMRFGPPPVTAQNVTVTRRLYDWWVVARTCREGGGWEPRDMVEYGPMTFEEAVNVAADVVLMWDRGI